MSDQTAVDRAAYNAVPYPGKVFPETHPDSLAVRGRLAGYSPPPVGGCRVLEIGCATGSNLLPMAASIPDATLVGVDISDVQIETARRTALSAGVDRVEFVAGDLLDFDPTGRPPFDYVIAHGVYSWVPPTVRAALMSLIGRCLSDRGLAFVSYNIYPGWRLKQPARELFRFHARDIADPKKRAEAARDIARFVAQPTVGFDDYKTVAGRTVERVTAAADWYLLHEEMEQFNEPVYFEAFASDCAAHGLKHVAHAAVKDDLMMWLPPAVRARIEAMGKTDVDREQYLDFLTGEAFRKSVLCRADRTPDGPIGPAAVPGLWAAGHPGESKKSDGAVEFTAPGGPQKLTSTDPGLIAAFRRLRTIWPGAVPVDELASVFATGAPAAEQLFKAYQAGLIELSTRPVDFMVADSDRPKVSNVALAQLGVEGPLADLRHNNVRRDALTDHVLPLLDGTGSPGDLATDIRRLFTTGKLPAGSLKGFGNWSGHETGDVRKLIRRLGK